MIDLHYAGLRGLRALGLIIFTASSWAQTITTTTTSAGTGTFTVAGSDLAASNQSTFSSLTLTSGSIAFGISTAQSLASMNDGSFYTGDASNVTDHTLTPNSGAVITLTFNTTINTLGYSLTAIDVFTGTGPGQGRARQNFSVAWAAPGSSSYTALFTVSNAGSTDDEVRTHTFDLTSGGTAAIVNGVGSLQFTFTDTNASFAQSMYRELDVLGAATAIPEPASVGLLASLAVFTAFAWRRRSASRTPA